MAQQIRGNIVDVFNQRIYYGVMEIADGRISSLRPIAATALTIDSAAFLLPGFIDSHVHIESSMLVPSEFAKIAVVHGTVATISDPHEIANVCGMQGVEYMIANGKSVPFKFHFGAPSCVPATHFETAGATLTVKEVTALLQIDEISYLSEMMNFPGVLAALPEVMEKMEAAKQVGKPIDGHAPGLRGEAAKKYIDAGISTDHECFTREEALEKLQYGMKILIREGSAAKNFDALVDLLNNYPNDIMFCSDDKHPDSLVSGHINQLCKRAAAKGVPIFNIIKAACVNPVLHYKMKVGLLREGDAADFIVVDDLVTFNVDATYIGGQLVASKGKSLISAAPAGLINQFSCALQTPAAFIIPYSGEKEIAVIEALDGQLITNKMMLPPTISGNEMICDVDNDILKIVVVNRYKVAPVAKAFIKNFGLKQGAIASTVAHDSHNIIAVGTSDESICKAINLVIAATGGISCVGKELEMIVPLPVGGLMSNKDGYEVAAAYTAIDKNVKEILGSTLAAPFMTLSFMALLVIPHLKLSDLGLFDGDNFSFIHSPAQ